MALSRAARPSPASFPWRRSLANFYRTSPGFPAGALGMAREFDVVFLGRFFLPTGPETCCVGVADGRIVKIAKQLTADYTLDFGHYLVLPGAVDAHVHFRDPGLTHKEDINSRSTAPVFAGVTSGLRKPN